MMDDNTLHIIYVQVDFSMMDDNTLHIIYVQVDFSIRFQDLDFIGFNVNEAARLLVLTTMSHLR